MLRPHQAQAQLEDERRAQPTRDCERRENEQDAWDQDLKPEVGVLLGPVSKAARPNRSRSRRSRNTDGQQVSRFEDPATGSQGKSEIPAKVREPCECKGRRPAQRREAERVIERP